ncbi:MarR family winged helix-turn-helix transcriptional regulator [Gracilibacillus kekensis]|uniref:DNA-binding transcriptional regulator, MarR family n=1 Tax=Gracilibacillus kekensis TaxID=1027249 RepID=A0A1M7Q9W6_9BACI|nr:MarR family transcriptional regulator [Gracilibacillus kekensis]SHN27468.1 DNA-binding transcriptional regulator, MarR family [Gracilibacillus kekensis]
MSKNQHRSVGKLISTINRASEIHINNMLKPYGISVTQMHFLMLLYQQEGVTQFELSKQLYVDKATATRAIQNLEKEELIIRKESTGDRRQNLVYVTEKAQSLKKDILTILAGWTSILTEGMSEDDKTILLSLLHHATTNAIRSKKSEKGES